MFKITAKSHENLYKLLSPHRPGQEVIEINPELLDPAIVGKWPDMWNRSPPPPEPAINIKIDLLEMAAEIVLYKLDKTKRPQDAWDYQYLTKFISAFIK